MNKTDTGLQAAINLFLREVSFGFRRAYCCSFSDVVFYIPHFVMAPRASFGIRENCYEDKVLVELELEFMQMQIIINIGHVTDFTNPIHTTDRHDVEPTYHGRTHLRTENYTLALSQAHKFLLAVMPQMHCRSLNVITVSPSAVSSLIHSFESLDDPRGAFTRVFLANM